MVIKPPTAIVTLTTRDMPKVFLAGSIEMGKAENWQKRLEDEIGDAEVLIMNPRRDDWDSSWKQEKTNEKFRQQVEWELEAQEEADLIVMYFQPGTQSPITLLELGLFKDRNLVVCCPEGFWRKGNVDITCEKYGINQVDTLQELIDVAVTWSRLQKA
jgi:hypothetical protein